MRDREDHRVRRLHGFQRHKLDAVFAFDITLVGKRIMHLHGEPVRTQFVDDVGDLRIARIGNIFFKGHTKNRHRGGAGLALEQTAHAFARDALADAVIDLAARQDHLRLIPGLLRTVGQVIRIDPDAVAADQPRSEPIKIPFGAGGGEHIAGIDAEAIEQGRKLVHESDVEVALRILDDFCGFRDLDRRRAMDAGFDHRAICLGDDLQRSFVLSGHHFGDSFEAVLLIAWIDPFR